MALRWMAGWAALAAASLSGCGATYTSPRVEEVAGGAVRIVTLDADSLAQANAIPYTPRALPAAFRQTAGTGTLRGAAVIPDPPGAATVAAPQLMPPPAREAGPYRIGPGDVLLLATRSSPDTVEELSGLLAAQNRRQGYTVRDDGAVSIPEVGTVRLAGLTLEEAEGRLFEKLAQQGLDPAFSLEVAEFNSARVAVGGAVAAPRVLSLGLSPRTLAGALADAGGLDVDDAGDAAIRFYRDGKLYGMPVSDYLKDPELQGLPVIAGDAIHVDEGIDLDRALAFYRQQIDVIALRQTGRAQAMEMLVSEVALCRAELADTRDAFSARADLGAVGRDHVYLAGEVGRQARVALPFEAEASLADVLFEQGGIPVATGDMGQIYVLRADTSGAITAHHLDAGNVARLTLATRLKMRPDDIVFVREQKITAWNRALQQVFPTVVSRAAEVTR